jgi:translation initiation factor 6 (eIF-6)
MPSISSLVDKQQFDTALDFISAQYEMRFDEVKDKLHCISNQIATNNYQMTIVRSLTTDDLDRI